MDVGEDNASAANIIMTDITISVHPVDSEQLV